MSVFPRAAMCRHLALSALMLALLAGCATRPEPRELRMAQPASVSGVAEERFGQPPWGRQGEFRLHGQTVRYERGAERLALLEALPAGVATPLRVTWLGPWGESAAVCEGWTPSGGAQPVGSRSWVLSCRWGAAPAAMLQIGESSSRRGQPVREGAYRRGELTLGLRSVQLAEGQAGPQSRVLGFEMLHQGTVVASLDLSGPQPRLRRPDPTTPVGRAATEAALALALVWEPGPVR